MCSSPSTADIEHLHEATKLHDRRDQPLEGLADALAQIRALEERLDVAVRFIGALLELATVLSPIERKRRQVVLRTAAPGSAASAQRAMHDEIRIAADRRGEVRVLRQRQPEVADVLGLIERLRHASAPPATRRRAARRSRQTRGDRLQVARA